MWSTMYTAFGEATVEVETMVNNLRFPGQYYDAETGLHYNFQRYYDPGIGRYVSADPMGFYGGDVNWYSYVANSPIAVLDPLGLSDYYSIPDDLIYSCKCGWIDWTHAAPGNVRGLWDDSKGIFPLEVIESREGGGFRVTVPITMHEPLLEIPEIPYITNNVYKVGATATYARFYFVNETCTHSLEQQKSIALGMFQETQWGFEQKLQGGFPFGWILPSVKASSFSEEDLPSDWISFYWRVQKYEEKDIKRICKPVSAEESRAIYKKLYGKHGKLVPNHEWKPVNHNDVAPSCSDCDPGTPHLEWPDGLNEIIPSPKGTCWRDWTWWRDNIKPFGPSFQHGGGLYPFRGEYRDVFPGFYCDNP